MRVEPRFSDGSPLGARCGWATQGHEKGHEGSSARRRADLRGLDVRSWVCGSERRVAEATSPGPASAGRLALLISASAGCCQHACTPSDLRASAFPPQHHLDRGSLCIIYLNYKLDHRISGRTLRMAGPRRGNHGRPVSIMGSPPTPESASTRKRAPILPLSWSKIQVRWLLSTRYPRRTREGAGHAPRPREWFDTVFISVIRPLGVPDAGHGGHVGL